MHLTFWERFGGKILFVLFALIAWRMVDLGLDLLVPTAYLFPITWVQFLPFQEVITSYLGPLQQEPWWMWVQIGITIFLWLIIFFCIRGAYYNISSADTPSLWVLLFSCLAMGFLFFYLLVAPAFDQMDIWWEDWPGVHQPQTAGEEP